MEKKKPAPDGAGMKGGTPMNKFKKWLSEFPERHPYIPLGLSIAALVASITMPILRKFLA